MGQVISKLLEKPPGPTEPFPLENVPVDVLFMITDFLDPVAYMSLAMTCKSFHYLLHNRARLDGEDRQAFVEQLERDLGAEKWYCHFCYKLHPFEPTWTPTGKEMWPDAPRKQNGIISFRTPCRYEPSRERGHDLPEELVRRATNMTEIHRVFPRSVRVCRLTSAQRLAPRPPGHEQTPLRRPHGLPLSNLRRCFADPDNRITPSFIQDWSARIIQDELILRGVHICFAREQPPGPDGRETVGRPFHRDAYHLCPHIVAAHTTPGPHTGLAIVYQLLFWRTLDFWECRNVLSSCDKCLTDYTVTVKRVKPPKKKKAGSEASTLDQLRSASERQIRRVLGLSKEDNAESSDSHTIKTYHQFGTCRSPTDVRWLGLTMDPGNTTRMLYRDHLLYPSGSIKRNWNRRDFSDYWNQVKKIVKPTDKAVEV
ncbi:hypothetical protein KJ359_001785 [Pestalotiopsis sp. 9143b]|nr:hypothetical protein KJ359_001785 [Pestalotiopsis sp. 9143b]